MTQAPRTPIALISGFLGAGKTTLINRLLRNGYLTDAALIVNEFGEAGIDHLLVETVQDDIVELSGGCLCCSIRGSLVDTLERVLERVPEPPARIVVETTGVADPLPVMQVILGHPHLNRQLAFAGLLAVVETVRGDEILRREPAARAQVALADHIVISKGDLDENRASLAGSLSVLNPHARIMASDDVAAVAAALMGSCPAAEHQKTELLSRQPYSASDLVSVSLTSQVPIARRALRLFFEDLQHRSRGEVLRMKGIVLDADAPDRPTIVHAVQDTLYPFEMRDAWPDAVRGTRLVVIGRHLDSQMIRDRFRALTGQAVVDTPDLAALGENPLAIPGLRF